MDLGIDGLTDVAEIGSGGSAVVYSAVQSALGRHVAVKILNVRFGVGDETERRRFQREQIALGRVSDLSGIVPLYESGFTNTDRPYLIMPFYEAGSLQGRLDAEGALPWREAAELMITVARAVQRAHTDSVLHRDLKPANIMVGRDGSPVVGDFGVARLLGSTTLFQSRALSTTPAYAPPEVFAGEESTVAVDVYGLGATLFALLNGSPAFVSVTGDMNVLALMRRVDLDPVPDLRGRGVPDPIAALVERSMAKAPGDRHATAAEWADELERALRAAATGTEPAARVIPVVPTPEPVEPEPTAPEEHERAPIEPEPVTHEPVAPERTVQDPAPTLVEPKPEPAEPEQLGQASVDPEPIEPEPITHEPVVPPPVEPEPTGTDPVRATPNVVVNTGREDVTSTDAHVRASASSDDATDRRRTWAWVLGTIGVLVVGLIIVAAIVGPDDDDPSSATAPDDAADEPAAEVPAADESVGQVSGDQPSAEEPATQEPATDADGGSITLVGPERIEAEAPAIQFALDTWGSERGIDVTYIGDPDWEANLELRLADGNPPDIAMSPQPSRLAELARRGVLVPLRDDATVTARSNWPASWNDLGLVDGVQYMVPTDADLKSLVWYQPARFEAAGYPVPTTFEEFTSLVDAMTADGGPQPLCVGIESGQATGWVYTDWVEDVVLRQHGVEIYDAWVAHEIPFNDPAIIESMDTVVQLWSDANVFAAAGSIAATSFADQAQPLVDGECYMHRQASFFARFFPEGTAFADGSEGAVDAFYLPGNDGERPLLVGGMLAAALNDRPEVHELAAFLSSAEFAEARQAAAQAEAQGLPASGFLSANPNVDRSVFSPIENTFLDILMSSEIVRFDASDQMPFEVGAGTFWSEGTLAVSGEKTAQEAADAIEASWR